MTGCKQIAGVTAVKVSLNDKTVTLRFDSRVTDRARVLAAVENVVANIR